MDLIDLLTLRCVRVEQKMRDEKWSTRNKREERERERERVCVCVCERESERGGGTLRKRGFGKKKTLLEAMFASLANSNSADNGELYTRLSLSLSLSLSIYLSLCHSFFSSLFLPFF